MKYLKLIVMALLPLAFAACSDDDFNSGNATVGFEETSVSVSESATEILLPIRVTGDHTGMVKVEVVLKETQGVSMEKDVNIIQTSQVIYLPAGTDEANVEFRTSMRTLTLDSNRYFTMEITSAEGATLDNATCQVNIRYFTMEITSAEGATLDNATCQVNIEEMTVEYEDVLGTWRITGTVMGSDESESYDLLIEEDVAGESYVCSGLLDETGKFVMNYSEAGPSIDLGQLVHQGNYGDPVGEAMTVLGSVSGESLVVGGTLQGTWTSTTTATFSDALVGTIFSLDGQYTGYVMFQWQNFQLEKL